MRIKDSADRVPVGPLEIYQLADNNWSENTITWNTMPAKGPALDSLSGPFAQGEWVTFDVSSVVTAGGCDECP